MKRLGLPTDLRQEDCMKRKDSEEESAGDKILEE